LNRLSATEYSDWQIYLANGTVQERLIDAHLAHIAAILSNRFRKKNAALKQTKDFLLLPQAPKPPVTASQMRSKIMAFAFAHGAEIIDKRDRDN
jgi:hypothetical protein